MLRCPLLDKLLMLIALTAASGCANTRYIERRSAAPPDRQIEKIDGGLKCRLHHVIRTNGPGAWITDAYWDEYVISIDNLTETDISITSIGLIGPDGDYILARYTTLASLEEASRSMADRYRGLGNAIATDAILRAGKQTAVDSAIKSGSMAPINVFAGIAALGPRVLGGFRERKDNEQIRTEFSRRRLRLPTKLDVGGAIRKRSVFLPIVPKPRALAITYQSTTGGGELRIDAPLAK